MNVFCIDIGNTNVHYGIVGGAGEAVETRDTPTKTLDSPGGALEEAVRRFHESQGPNPPFSFSSVVPDATARIRRLFERQGLDKHLFHLTCHVNLGIRISYPHPEEIGQDRLANAVAATAMNALPCIVIDMGTAVTLDVVTESGGYEGGVIAPGLRVMTRYLKEQTALLPEIDEDWGTPGAIGKSTTEAMRIGCRIGFGGMIDALIQAVSTELTQKNEPLPTLLATGGSAQAALPLLPEGTRLVPDITLRGLANARRLNP